MVHDPNIFANFVRAIARLVLEFIKLAEPSLGRKLSALLVALSVFLGLGFSTFLVWNSERLIGAGLDGALKIAMTVQSGERSVYAVMIVALVLCAAVVATVTSGRHRQKSRGRPGLVIKLYPRGRNRGDSESKDRSKAA